MDFFKKIIIRCCKIFKCKMNFQDTCKQQDQAFLKVNSKATQVVVFVVIPAPVITGGLRSIVSLYRAASAILKSTKTAVVFMTYPSPETHYRNELLKEMFPIFRFSQILLFKNAQQILIHLPEMYAATFFRDLSPEYKAFISSRDTHINILNQNIELMPCYEQFSNLHEISKKITQTTAHDKSNSQRVCDAYRVPLHHFSVYIDLLKYKKLNFSKRKKVILVSHDGHQRKNEILEKMKFNLQDYEIKVIGEMPFDACMNLTGATLFSMTFGEGFDGYLIHGAYMGNLCFCVYNDTFFPDDSFLELENVYESYQQMLDCISEDIRKYSMDEKLYHSIIAKNVEKMNIYYSYDKFVDNQKRFYQGKYDYYPASIPEIET